MSGAALIQQLEAAGEGSRELDRQIMALTYRWEQRHIGCICWDDADDTCCPGGKHLDWVWVDPETDKWVTNAIDGFEFTSSVDRALALAERVLPGWDWLVRAPSKNARVPDKFFARLESPDFDAVCWTAGDKTTTNVLSGVDAIGHASTPALALCAAIIRARSAGEGGA